MPAGGSSTPPSRGCAGPARRRRAPAGLSAGRRPAPGGWCRRPAPACRRRSWCCPNRSSRARRRSRDRGRRLTGSLRTAAPGAGRGQQHWFCRVLEPLQPLPPRRGAPPVGRSRAAAGCRPPPGPGAHGPPAAPAPPAARPGGDPTADRNGRRSRQQGWGGSSEQPPPPRRQGRLAAAGRHLHAGGEEQGADRHPAFQAGIHLTRGMEPVG